VVVLERHGVQERVPAVGVRVGAHAAAALAAFAATARVRSDLGSKL
jgi:hypothetical protein